MATKKVLLLLLAAVLPSALAHGTEEDVWGQLNLIDPNILLIFAAAVFIAAIVASLALTKLKESHKKILFLIISVPIVISTAYLSATTVYLNVKSESHGPVHWHADYEIFACGQKYELAKPAGLKNFVGDPTVHEHGDNRIHVEGVLLKLEQASLHEYFESVGGEFTDGTLGLPTEHGYKKLTNGDLCNGRPAKWYVFVNGRLQENAQDYIISPYSTVPPGDKIKFVFSETQLSEDGLLVVRVRGGA
ncbi:MAG: hypothetical protein HYT16_01715 [DPANN group archaeon]|nr:hypothetical protein [DPANN group archaeon]